MIDPSLELQGAIVGALKGSGEVAAIVGTKVFDSVPTITKPEMPYVALGQPHVAPDGADCIDGADVSYPINGWTAGPKSVAIKQLGKAIAASLDGNEFALSGHRTVICDLEDILYLDEPDGQTKHVIVTLHVVTEPTD